MLDLKNTQKIHKEIFDLTFLKMLVEGFGSVNEGVIFPLSRFKVNYTPSEYLTLKVMNKFINNNYIIPVNTSGTYCLMDCKFLLNQSITIEYIDNKLIDYANDLYNTKFNLHNPEVFLHNVVLGAVITNECLGYLEYYCAKNRIDISLDDNVLIEERLICSIEKFIYKHTVGECCAIIYSSISKYVREMNEARQNIKCNFPALLNIIENYFSIADDNNWTLTSYTRNFNLKMSHAAEYCHKLLPILPDLYALTICESENIHNHYFTLVKDL